MARTDAQLKQCMDACHDFHAMCLWMAMTDCLETITKYRTRDWRTFVTDEASGIFSTCPPLKHSALLRADVDPAALTLIPHTERKARIRNDRQMDDI